jgi:replicative DNA helicase
MLRGGLEDGGDGGRFRQLTDDEVRQLGDAGLRLGQLPLLFEGQVNTVAGIRARARRMKRRGGLDLVVVDYLGLLRGSREAQRQGKVQEISELTLQLKALAVDLDVPVVLLSQLSREVEKREDKTPALSDLRDSGSIEQDSDLVMFLFRAHYYLMRNPPPPQSERETGEKYEARLLAHARAVAESEGRGTVIIAKQRQGRIGPVRMRWADELTWFYDDSERPPGGPGGD